MTLPPQPSIEKLADAIETGNVLFNNGELEQSESVFRTLLAAFPLHPPLYNSVATVLDKQERFREAIAYYSKALSLQPDFTIARYNMANSLKKIGDIETCKENLRLVTEADPDFLLAWQTLATIFFDEGKLEESAKCLEKLLTLDPEIVLAWAELGDIYHKIGNADNQAIACFERVIANRPDFATAYNSKGLILHEKGDYAEAEECYRAALSLTPDDHFFMNNLALSLLALGKTDEALQWFNRSIQLEDSPTTRFNRGMTYLIRGDCHNGWSDYSCRFKKDDPVYLAPLEIPEWRGEELYGRSIIVRMEQGYGDNIQCIRFLTVLKRSGATVFVECIDDSIKSLLTTLEHDYTLYIRGDVTPIADFQIPFFSIPGIIGITLENIPFASGYLTPEQSLAEYWRAKIKTISTAGYIKAGIVWGGRKSRLNANRSVELDDLFPLFSLPKIQWFSLQTGKDLEQLKNNDNAVIDLGKEFITFADTAAAINALDLVITIDTSVAHLSGALGKKTFVMLKSAPDWRWLLGRSDSPWYSSLTLFRQAHANSWGSVIYSIEKKMTQMTEYF